MVSHMVLTAFLLGCSFPQRFCQTVLAVILDKLNFVSVLVLHYLNDFLVGLDMAPTT